MTTLLHSSRVTVLQQSRSSCLNSVLRTPVFLLARDIRVQDFRTYSTAKERRPVQIATADTTSRQVQTDKVNPPESTLPPSLNLPTQGESATPIYWFQLGRAYGKFYWAGVKATWQNHKHIRDLKQSLRQDGSKAGLPPRYNVLQPHLFDACELGVSNGSLSRADLQCLVRDAHDVGKLPLFGLLVIAFGEWLPLLVPFMPGVVPKTCRIPKQIDGMRKAQEARRKETFRDGIKAPDEGKLQAVDQKLSSAKAEHSESSQPRLTMRDQANAMAMTMELPELLHVSRSLGLHRRLWDRVGLAPPHVLLRGSVARRLQYLGLDDTLLNKQRGVSALKDEEVAIACEERGIDVAERKTGEMRTDLAKWLDKMAQGSTVREFFDVLFKR